MDLVVRHLNTRLIALILISTAGPLVDAKVPDKSASRFVPQEVSYRGQIEADPDAGQFITVTPNMAKPAPRNILFVPSPKPPVQSIPVQKWPTQQPSNLDT